MCTTLLAITIANSPINNVYNYIFKEIHFIGHFNLHKIVNDFLMAIFFLVVGCEIKHEILHGNLSSIKKAGFPVIAACGGVALPAVIYLIFNYNTTFVNGIGIPISTDIAFAIGIFMILKNKLDPNLKIFLLSLAVVDDLMSILVIGIAYSSQINMYGVIGTAIVMCILVYMNKILKIDKITPYIIMGIILWYFVYTSEIHSTISGVLLAMTIPSKSVANKKSLIEEIQHKLTPFCNFFILPLFAFSNTAIALNMDVNYGDMSTLMLGIIFGLVVGKPLGIMLFSYIGVKLHLVEKPQNTSWGSLLQVAILAGVGFTMSIFVSEIAFSYNQNIVDTAKISILISALLSAGLTYTSISLKPILSRKYVLSHIKLGK